MSSTKAHSWKILGLGKVKTVAEKTEQHLQEIGYKNAKVIALENDKASDDIVIELLKEGDWDGVCFGAGINGFNDDVPKEVTTLHWFNRLINLVHEHAPKAKVVFVTGPDDLVDSLVRVLGTLETPIQTV